MATLIGSQTNLVFLKIYESPFQNGQTINFANWMIFALPIYIFLMIAAFLILFFF
jgi:di/tricarboxylate transporter